MKINSITNTYSTQHSKQIQFNGLEKPITEALETSLSLKSLSLIKKMDRLIEQTYTEMRKSGTLMDTPKFRTADSKGNLVTVKPLYHGIKNNIFVEIDDGKYIDRIIINRVRPRDYKYERSVITDHGSATIKSFDGLREHNHSIEDRINNYIEKYFPKILPAENYSYTKKSLGLSYGEY